MKNAKSFLSPKRMSLFLFNLIESLYHRASPQEIELIKNTNLFNHISPAQFKVLIDSIKLIKYPEEKVVFKEGDLADALYVILDGAVRVFTYNAEGKKIPLARLSPGDYFGEQALLGESKKTRNAYIETITQATLIKLPSKAIFPLWEKDQQLTRKLKKIGYQQAIHALSLSTNLYSDIDIKSFIEQSEEDDILDLQHDEIIFNFGDPSKNVYFILDGKVKLFFPASGTEKEKTLFLHKKHLLGELGVLEGKPRQATARADGHVRLLVMHGDHFKSMYSESPQLKRLLSALKRVYQLPTVGTVEQYIGSSDATGPTVTNVFKVNDGRTIISARSLNQDLFTMSVSGLEPSKEYKHEKDANQFAKIYMANQSIARIEFCGEWRDLPLACQMMLNDKTISDAALEKFQLTGELVEDTPAVAAAGAPLCICMSISKDQIQSLIDQGIKDVDTLSQETGAATVCGSCRYKILEMVGENQWISAVMERADKHNSYIQSYLIKPTNSKFKVFIPGQHVVVQAKVHDNWVERSYTLSNTYKENEPYRVTIKKEPKGLFTQWIFDEAPDQFDIKISQPQGNFMLDTNASTPALCFAGGVGITPFISFMKELEATQLNKKIHLVYCALTKNDFIFTEEFNSIASKMSTVTVFYRSTDDYGLLKPEEILSLVQSTPGADVYICGPEAFDRLITQTLKQANYDQKKVHSEQFVHAGSA